MNNYSLTANGSGIEIEKNVDLQPIFREQTTELVAVIEALEAVSTSSYWKILDKEIFSSDLVTLRSRLSKENNTTDIFRLQGEIARCEKYDLVKLIEIKRNQLTNIKKQLHE